MKKNYYNKNKQTLITHLLTYRWLLQAKEALYKYKSTQRLKEFCEDPSES